MLDSRAKLLLRALVERYIADGQPVGSRTLSNRPIVLPCAQEIVIEIMGGREISANFDMQTFTSLIHGDQIKVTRSQHQLRLLHPTGWSHFDTLRNKLHWNEGAIGSQH